MASGLAKLFIDIKAKILSISNGLYSYAAAFNGTGMNDATFTGTYAGFIKDDTFTVTITVEDTIDSFSWESANGSGTDIPIQAGPQLLTNGIYIEFAALTGHTEGDIFTYTITSDPLIKFCQVWNDQLKWEMEGQLYDYLKPAVFIEFDSPNPISQLGNGVQQFDPLMVRLHIIHEYYNAIDGNGVQEQNLEVFAVKQRIYQMIQKFEPDYAVAFVRSSEQQQYDHNMLYHYVQEYKTNFIDNSLNEPIGSVTNTPPITIDILSAYNPSPFLK